VDGVGVRGWLGWDMTILLFAVFGARRRNEIATGQAKTERRTSEDEGGAAHAP
jgi:hypothetical protein